MKRTLPDLLDYNLDYVIVRVSAHLFYSATKSCVMCNDFEFVSFKNICPCFQIGINPGLMAAFIGRWFPGPGNHFCKLCDNNNFESYNTKCFLVIIRLKIVLIAQRFFRNS